MLTKYLKQLTLVHLSMKVPFVSLFSKRVHNLVKIKKKN